MLDLSGVRFIASIGFAELLMIRHEATTSDQEMRILADRTNGCGVCWTSSDNFHSTTRSMTLVRSNRRTCRRSLSRFPQSHRTPRSVVARNGAHRGTGRT